jgi:hypothetical protein
MLAKMWKRSTRKTADRNTSEERTKEKDGSEDASCK